MLTVILMTAFFGLSLAGNEFQVPLLMPDVDPMITGNASITRLCTAMNVSSLAGNNIIKITACLRKNPKYHIVVNACRYPGYVDSRNPAAVWDCNIETPMSGNVPKAEYCSDLEQHGVFFWDINNQDELVLPAGVGILVGGESEFQYLILMIHYFDRSEYESNRGMTDNSGVILTMEPVSPDSVWKRAGVFALEVVGGFLDPHTVTHVESARRIDDDVVIHPFAVRIHTHHHGKVVSGWKIDPTGKWSLIARGNPMHLHDVILIEDENMTITKGDVVAARCTMNNTSDYTLELGGANFAENCEFAMHYYVDGGKLLPVERSIKPGPPDYFWSRDPLVGKLPQEVEIQASQLGDINSDQIAPAN